MLWNIMKIYNLKIYNLKDMSWVEEACITNLITMGDENLLSWMSPGKIIIKSRIMS